MTKKAGVKKRVIITVTVVLLALSALLAVLYHNCIKEICVMEQVEHMEQREGVSVNNILVEIKYSVITDGEDVENYLYIFENGDVYSGCCINYFYVGITANQDQRQRGYYFYHMDNRYWDYLYDQCYWGRLSPRDLNGIIKELAQVEVVPDYVPIDAHPEPTVSMGIQKGLQTETQIGIQVGTQIVTQMESQTERTYDEENDNFYGGHSYRGRVGTEGLEWISRGSAEKVTMYRYDEHAHNAIDIIKSTWAYEQWTNQIFGEGWKERIDLKDELIGGRFEVRLSYKGVSV